MQNLARSTPLLSKSAVINIHEQDKRDYHLITGITTKASAALHWNLQ